MKTLIQKIILSKAFTILFMYTFVLCALTFLLIGESLIELIIFNLLK
jgi:Trk-type K+ transport system membrane component